MKDSSSPSQDRKMFFALSNEGLKKSNLQHITSYLQILQSHLLEFMVMDDLAHPLWNSLVLVQDFGEMLGADSHSQNKKSVEKQEFLKTQGIAEYQSPW